MTGLQIAHHVHSLSTDGSRDVGTHQIGLLDHLNLTRETGEDQLSDLADRSSRVDISFAGSLKTDKGQNEREDNGKDGRVHWNLEVESHQNDGEDARDEQTTDPP